MTRAQGFARGDLDTSFPIDDKFIALRASTDSLTYYAAAGVYWHVVAATWREASRKAASRIAPDATDLIAHLVRVGLFDTDECVPKRVTTQWIGRATRARRSATDRKARNRAGLSRAVPRDMTVTPRHAYRRDGRVGTVGTVGTDDVAGAQEEPPPLTRAIDYLEQRTGRPWHGRPGQRMWDTLDADLRDKGLSVVLDTYGAIPGEHPDFAQLIFAGHDVLYPVTKVRPPSAAEREAAEGKRQLDAITARRRTNGAGR